VGQNSVHFVAASTPNVSYLGLGRRNHGEEVCDGAEIATNLGNGMKVQACRSYWRDGVSGGGRSQLEMDPRLRSGDMGRSWGFCHRRGGLRSAGHLVGRCLEPRRLRSTWSGCPINGGSTSYLRSPTRRRCGSRCLSAHHLCDSLGAANTQDCSQSGKTSRHRRARFARTGTDAPECWWPGSQEVFSKNSFRRARFEELGSKNSFRRAGAVSLRFRRRSLDCLGQVPRV